MNDKDMKDIAFETAKEISKDVYTDVVKPVSKPTGEILGLIPRAIKVALSPLERWILQGEYNMAEIQRLLEEKLKNTSPDMIEAPAAHIAIPAMQYISYCIDNKELRNMYANLLATSMNKDVKDDVHPAYVEIIKQLCPDEAKILKYMYAHNTIPVIEIKFVLKNGEKGQISKGFSIVAEMAQCEHPHNGNQYFENLIRLGLVMKSDNPWFMVPKRYDDLLNHPRVKEEYNYWNRQNFISSVEYSKCAYEITRFCDGFFNVCIYEPSDGFEDK